MTKNLKQLLIFNEICDIFITIGKGKGKGKKSKKVPESEATQSEIAREAEKRLQDFLSMNNLCAASAPPQSISSHQSNRQSDYAWTNDSSSLRNPIKDATKAIFIKKLELTINGTPIDQIEDKQTEDECIQAYWKMFTFNGQMNTLFTNGISYSDFR